MGAAQGASQGACQELVILFPLAFTLLKGDSQGYSQGITGRCTYLIDPHCGTPFGLAQGDPRSLIHVVQGNSVNHSVDQNL